MIIYQSVFSWISTILTIACLVWCVGLGLFVLIKWIINKIKAKKEINQHMTEHDKQRKRWFGDEQRRKKGK